MVQPWRWDDDGDDEFDWLDGLMCSGAADVVPSRILERVEEARPRWQRRAACRGRTDVSWFATEDRARAGRGVPGVRPP